MRDIIISGVKTAVQAGVGIAITWLAGLGIDIPAGEATLVVTAFAVGVTALALNWLGQKFPWLNRIVSLGISNQPASY